MTPRNKTGPNPWPMPILLDKIVSPPFPPGILPYPIDIASETISQAYQTPVELFVAPALVSLAAVVGKKYEVVVRPDHIEQLNLYAAAVAKSGERKSYVYKRAVAPIIAWENRQAAELESKIKRAESLEKSI